MGGLLGQRGARALTFFRWRGDRSMAASGGNQHVGAESTPSPGHYQIEKWYYDYAANIEAVNIHYACTPIGAVPDWNSQRATRFMPLGENRMRRKVLKLPARVLDSTTGEFRDRYLLHHYFEIFVDGDSHYSPLYTEEVVTGAGSLSVQEPGVSVQPEKQEPDFSS